MKIETQVCKSCGGKTPSPDQSMYCRSCNGTGVRYVPEGYSQSQLRDVRLLVDTLAAQRGAR